MHVSSSENLADLENIIGYKFKKKALIKEALTHKSYAHEKRKDVPLFNERMEFLGDSVLELIVSEYLYSTYTKYTEANLSKVKAYAVQESTLADISKKISLGTYLRLGKGEEMTGGRKKDSLLADAFEALLAAIYLDGGYKKAKAFSLAHLAHRIDDLAEKDFVFDFKTKLQETSQAQYGVLPKYVIHKEEGPEHKKTFEVKVFINDDFMGSGKGKTKKAAAQKAAEEGLQRISERHETDI
ncbi:MAG: ribonuclease III [Nitrospiraceae bacterium]|nr:MAG: ribonuclease III [Nitrospiraceae bacterium]